MKAAIINIGDEILIGQIINTNAAWMAEKLTGSGISVQRIHVVPDKEDAIIQCLAESFKDHDLILMTGGLGPTKDDITKTVLCRFFDTPLVFNEDAYEMIRDFFASRRMRVSELNRQQAELPAACRPVTNRNGTAPGMWFEQEGKILVSMPGVPYEMEAMMEDVILPALITQNGGQYILQKTILTHGMGESMLTRRLDHWENTLPESISLAYLPSPGQVRLRLTATGSRMESLEKDMTYALQGLEKRIGGMIFGYDKATMQEVLGKLLLEKQQSLATAESCTGGYLAHLITSVPGSSAYYKGSIVSYHNSAKENLLAVDPVLLEKEGAVSEAVVRQMAENGRAQLQADWCIASSGIAGPEGGTESKPVGLVWIALAGPEGTIAKEFRFGKRRLQNIQVSAMAGLNMLRKALIN